MFMPHESTLALFTNIHLSFIGSTIISVRKSPRKQKSKENFMGKHFKNYKHTIEKYVHAIYV